ncbi:MAG: asparagine synthase (glutamine-hydrolyzing) [Acidobacteriota bacterium]
MCGITGFVSREPLSRGLLAAMNETLRHRGPDDAGVWLSPASTVARDGSKRTEGEVGLAQQRLAILDLSPAGHNPMANDDGSLWITYNGEVFNFLEVRRDLEAAGFRFRSGTDTEVILKAYEKWGRACLDRFVGMFAFAIWDSKRRSLFAARDRLGIKPFYYLWNGRELAFASELKALRLHPAFEGEIDADALAQYLRFQYVPSPRSIYREVFKLPPGFLLELEGGRVRTERYWDPVAIASRGVSSVPEKELSQKFEALVSEAVHYRMISDVPLGAFLSGGVDSSTVVALMREKATGPVKTFSIGFEEKALDESPYAREVARHLGTEHHEKICTMQDALDLIPMLAKHYDEPFADSSAIPTMLVSQFAREHVTVALSGDGGDELFWGYARYFAYQRMGSLLKSPRWLRRGAASMMSLIPDRRFRRAGSLLREESASDDRYLRFVKILMAEEVKSLCGRDAELPALYEDAKRRLGGSRPDAVSIRDLVSYLPEDILTKVDRASMAFSLEARVPLLDHRLVEFSLALPFHLKYRDGQGKYLLRQVLDRRVPRRLIDRPKIGFGVPLRRWFAGELRPALQETLSPAAVARAGLVDPDGVARLLGKDFDIARTRPEVIWLLYVLHLWGAEAASARHFPQSAAPTLAHA